MDFYLEKLNIEHTQKDFDCGDKDINSFFERSLDEVLLNNSQVYVLTGNSEVIGFFALTMSSIRAEFDEKVLKHPVCLLCQLGVNIPFQGKGYGTYLIEQAIEKALKISNEIGCKGIVVETYNEKYIDNFYGKQGFIKLNDIKQRNGSTKYILFYRFEKFVK